ncbi:MAG: MCE family protein [Alphaproteobacteria bacterium]|nr:MCE family protein [Alphaproteobacteria bacterium]
METRANYVAVGAFVIACMLGLVITVVWLAGIQYSQEYEYFQTNFTGAVTGLGKGTVVRYNGIEVGRVTDLQFDPNDPRVVIATLQVQPNLKIRTDSTSSIEPEGLTGGSYVEISGGSKNAPLLTAKDGERYPVIRSSPSALQKITTGVPELLGKLNTAADRLNDILTPENQAALTHILANLDKTTSVLAARSNDIDATLGHISEASKGLPQTVADTDAGVKKFGKLSDDADAVVHGDSVAQLDGLLADARKLVASLTKLSDQLNRQPTSVLFGDRRKGYTPK